MEVFTYFASGVAAGVVVEVVEDPELVEGFAVVVVVWIAALTLAMTGAVIVGAGVVVEGVEGLVAIAVVY